MEETTLEELTKWYADQYMGGYTSSLVGEGSWNSFDLDIDNLLSKQDQMDYIKELTSIVSADFYSKYTPMQISDNPDLTYEYYYAMVESTNETKLRALHKAHTLRTSK